MSSEWVSECEADTRAVGASLADRLLPDGVLLLQGDLGSGKTVLTQGLAAALGIDEREVQSPSFTLMREHRGHRGRLVHIDLYRLDRREVEGLGLWETLAGPGIKVVEWAERLPFAVPEALTLLIHEIASSGQRKLILVGEGATASRP